MTILTRYMLNEFLRVLLLALTSMIALYMVIDFFEKIDEFIIYKTPVTLCLSYYLYKLPLIAFHMAPIAFLLSTVITVGSFSRSSELTAMKSCGLSLLHVIGPILCAALIYSTITAVANEFIVPFATQKANYIFNVNVRKNPPQGVYQRDKIWYRSTDGSIWQIGIYNVAKRELKNISVFRYEGGGNLRERVDAAQGVWNGGDWIFYKGSIRTFDSSGSGLPEKFEKRKIYFSVTPEDLTKMHKHKEEMTLRELYDYASKVKKEGLDNSRYMVDFHQKISYPFISLITALIGIPFSLKSVRSGGVMLCVGISIVTGFSYYFIFSLGISLGYGGALPPFLAAWGTNILFAIMGLYLIITIDSETILRPTMFHGKAWSKPSGNK